MTLEWVLCHVVPCHICWHGGRKGAWRGNTECGGMWTWGPLPGEPMSPVLGAITLGSLRSLNLCGDLRGVCFGTAHFLVALQHWITFGWCRQWRQAKRVYFKIHRMAVLAGARPVYDPSMQQTHEGTGAASRATLLAFASCECPLVPPPPPLAPRRRHGGLSGGADGLHNILVSDGLFLGAVRLKWFQGMLVCLFVDVSSVVVKFCRLMFIFWIGGAKIKIYTSYQG